MSTKPKIQIEPKRDSELQLYAQTLQDIATETRLRLKPEEKRSLREIAKAMVRIDRSGQVTNIRW